MVFDQNWIVNLNKVVADWAFWTALIPVILFSYSRFTVTLDADDDELSLPVRLRSFTTAFRFWLAACVYIGCYSFLYLVLLVASQYPQIQKFLADWIGAYTTETPAWAALAATAFLPAVPGFSHFDEWLRHQLQQFASIPLKAEMLAREVLAVVNPAEPALITKRTTTQEVLNAIAKHHERFDHLNETWPKLGTFSRFEKSNYKTIQRLRNEFSAEPKQMDNIDKSSAMYIERKYRMAVQKFAKLILCSMLFSGNSEFRIRRKWQNSGISVSDGELDFGPNTLIGSMFTILIAVIVFCYISIVIYYGYCAINGSPVSEPALGNALVENTGLFLFWAGFTVLIYLPPLAVAAGAAMYFLDRRLIGHPDTPIERVIGAVFTFASTALLSFFVLLPYGVLIRPLIGRLPMEIYQLAAWALPPAALATAFLLLSIMPRTGARMERLLYVLVLSGVAALASTLVANLTGPLADELGTLPIDSFYFLAFFAPLGLGASLGWLLSYTRVPAGESETMKGLRQQTAS